MLQEQSVQTPLGISVFGSSIVRVEPDIVSLKFSVSRAQQHPKDSFREVRKAAQYVRKYLGQAEISEMGSSRVSISPTFQYTAGEQKFVGYTAKITFHVLLRQLDNMEDVVAGIIDAGVNELTSVEFQTTHLKEVRAEARRRAVDAGREKAENYCNAAGVSLGRIIHIEDVNPDNLQIRDGHIARETQSDDTSELRVFNPGSIIVAAAVVLAFEIVYETCKGTDNIECP